jgi:capsular polysaccharide biosynthesis protein
MNSDADKPEFSASRKIYAALLRAYPRRHREEYGAAMAQLFRDQCRDAWGESKNFGLLKLWLRVLPDLVSTSIMERLAAMNEGKTMSDKLSSLASFGPSPGKIFTRVFLVVFLLVVIVSTAVTFILPESYASTATINIDTERSANNYDPYFLQTQFQEMKSLPVLESVVEKLQLKKTWSQKYFAGEPLKTAEVIEILKGRLAIRPVGNTSLVKITIYSDDKLEAPQIANAIAESYRDYRMNTPVLKATNSIPILSSIQITDLAEPAARPVKPNKPLNITIGVFVGIFAAGIIGGLAALVTTIRKRRRGTNAPA